MPLLSLCFLFSLKHSTSALHSPLSTLPKPQLWTHSLLYFWSQQEFSDFFNNYRFLILSAFNCPLIYSLSLKSLRFSISVQKPFLLFLSLYKCKIMPQNIIFYLCMFDLWENIEEKKGKFESFQVSTNGVCQVWGVFCLGGGSHGFLFCFLHWP